MAKWLDGGGLMAARIRNHDWASTPLGPLDSWPDVLKTSVALCLASRFPQAVLWGDALITLHNDAFSEILGGKPTALGRPFSDVWQEAWSNIRHLAQRALAGEAVYIEDFPLMIERHGSPERAYFTFCYSPVRDHDGKVVGMLDTVTETTASVVANRRLNFLDSLGRAAANATDPERIMATTTHLLGEHLQLSSCAYAVMAPDEDGFTICGDWVAPGSPRLIGQYRLADFGALAVSRLRAGLALVIDDNLSQLPAPESATFQAIGITATICMPLIKEGRLTALMAIHDKQPRAWTDYEQTLIGEVTERCWAHIQRVQANAEVREALTALEALNTTLEQRVEERTSQLLHTEAVLRQTQKLEAIGQLTGGVAHDFNNLLTIIRSSIHFLQRPDLDENRRSRYLKTVSDTVDRGAKLTGQLLAFARRQALSPQVFDAGPRLEAMAEMLDTATGARIQVSLELPDTPCHVHADLGQLETAVINLMINGRDAMAGAGTLRLRLEANQQLPALRGQAPQAGPFAAISVVDSGVGIAPHLLERIFDPFFTTKAAGQGTGLGLSQVFGFVKQSGGDVQVSSREGLGTTFTLYLPQVAQADAEVSTALPTLAPNGERRHILVVEDNPDVGSFTAQILRDHGYRISWAISAEDALKQIASTQGGFDAVFSDVVMPGMGGLALARELRRSQPHLPVILTSGYSEAIAEGGHQGFAFLAKPYSAEQVCRMLGDVLGRQ
ncbi:MULTISPECIES: ATP-binding protein [unclassified Pseudomonas]|uniref:ATP-binding protein n=1 Tax=unclassified Pseudomonas TaxID=196821 RepID=UPI000C8833C8|nr:MULTISPECIES: ATP-binding protein [unclassified Pseudomonas]PNA00853.1 hybrid sensor histidine kinase/response regulator [Pseudomonas sp. FW305-42]PNA20555.1 hybrid sensor histidine kinase/response regulator [Pseudomonas sp. MPR-R1B]PNB22309.1 hybrid sensor histidine kinase/response regulator [Pseudomonas sp. DP16D-E2]PNB43399.1 hybrid sensor histidine kinase/response regulator [Pseudomonas sp. FW305-17]PNB61451.1 hybrid sensor histidine kinase/response regulator [Pseudomonas sp. GW531-E2]